VGDSVLVTGGSGFIGAWVLRELVSRGLRPIIYDLQRADDRWRRILGRGAEDLIFIQGDLVNRALLKQTVLDNRVTSIIHLAALLTPACQQDPYVGCEANVLGSVAVFELAREFKSQIRGISYASSYAVYGPEADDGPLGLTSAENRPPSFYGAFKLAVDSIADQYWRHFGLASVGIRPHVAYGPERTVGLTAGPSLAARAAATGEPFEIGYTGRLGYDYAEDVALAFVRAALETPAGATVVDLPSQSATVEEFVSDLQTVVPAARISIKGPAVPSNIPPEPHPITRLFPDWRATPLIDGIRKTVEFYRRRE
jgi:UDP-glucose 4-epimerase